MRPWFVLPLFLLILLLPAALLAGEFRCAGPAEVVVRTDQATDLDEICTSAAKAFAFLARFELMPKQPITIDIVDHPIDSEGILTYGRYEKETDRIELMSYTAILAAGEKPKMFGEPFDRIHYSGLIAHEVAHAVVEPNLVRKKFSTTPQEYLAYATQLAVLPEVRREQIIVAMDVEPWQGGDLISNAYMAMDPGKFAVKSYLHLTSLAEPKAFVLLLLDSRWMDIYVPKDLAHRPGN
jgi:Family of unknown function (DUF6639)